jgi:sterol desaturase/sphingolipid hydroxylase (fatty acid hydroxylase superfamily)
MWETIIPFFEQKNRARHGLRNLVMTALNGAVLGLVFAGLNLTVALAAQQYGLGLLRVIGLSGTALLVTAFLAVDAWTYWWHRFNHLNRFLWRFHRMHHSDPDVDVTTGTRFHVGEVTISSIVRLALIPIIGIPLEAIILYDAVQLPVILLHHSNIALPSRVDRTLSLLLVTPFMHKVHHSRVRNETDSNFSSVLSVWDRMFGSFIRKENCREIRFGLRGYDGDDRQSIKGLLSTPFFRNAREMS